MKDRGTRAQYIITLEMVCKSCLEASRSVADDPHDVLHFLDSCFWLTASCLERKNVFDFQQLNRARPQAGCFCVHSPLRWDPCGFQLQLCQKLRLLSQTMEASLYCFASFLLMFFIF